LNDAERARLAQLLLDAAGPHREETK